MAGQTIDAHPAAAATGGCRPVGGGTFTPGGAQQATVVVDTGAGPVWSACITFAGSVSGVEALELAARTIPGLDPVYDIYAGQGRAICQLRGVGNPPPDCLGKSAEYWSYFRNGTYAAGGAGAAAVHGGDVEGWRWGRGTPPRAATVGTEAAAAPPRPAPPTTTPAAPPVTSPGPVATTPVSPPGVAPPEADPAPGSSTASTSRPSTGELPASSSPSTTSVGAGSPADGARPGAGGDLVAGDAAGAEQAGAARPAATSVGPATDGRAKRSPVSSIAGFVAALGLVAGAAVLVRRRRTA
ncbi:MAG: hypothetical protein ABIP03_12270 [Aquihabitans sp.]